MDRFKNGFCIGFIVGSIAILLIIATTNRYEYGQYINNHAGEEAIGK